MVGVFAVCWLPLHNHNVSVYFHPSIRYIQPVWLVDFTVLLYHANPLINPIIYALHLREMKKAFRKMIKPISSKVATCILGMFLTSKFSQTDVTIETQRSLLPPCTFSFDGYCVINKVLLMLDDKFVLNSKI